MGHQDRPVGGLDARVGVHQAEDVRDVRARTPALRHVEVGMDLEGDELALEGVRHECHGRLKGAAEIFLLEDCGTCPIGRRNGLGVLTIGGRVIDQTSGSGMGASTDPK